VNKNFIDLYRYKNINIGRKKRKHWSLCVIILCHIICWKVLYYFKGNSLVRLISCLFFVICINFNDFNYFSLNSQSIFNLLYATVINYTYLGLACLKLLGYYLIGLLILIVNWRYITIILSVVLFLGFKTRDILQAPGQSGPFQNILF
jgi:hypothetical protein